MEAQNILQDTFFILFYGGVIMLNVVAALYLLFRRGNAIAPEVKSPVRLRRWAAAFLTGCALSHVSWLLYVSYGYSSVVAYVIVCGLDLLLLMPTITGILLSMLQDRHRPVWPFLLMLVPAFVLISVGVIRGDALVFIPLAFYVTLWYALLILFIYKAVRQYGRWLRDNFADLERKEVSQSFMILAMFLLFFLIYSITTERSMVVVYLFQAVNVVVLTLLVWRVESLQELSESASPGAEPAGEDEKASAPASPSIPVNIGPLLKKHCEDGQLYLHHDLTLAQLASVIGTNRYYLSLYFAQQGLTYNAYINGLRVNHFIRSYHKAASDGRSITAQQLAFESGYHSYSTFSAAFKQYTGKAVTAWMKDVAE